MKIIKLSAIWLIFILSASAEDARTIRPEKWFPKSDFAGENYSHHLHTYTFFTSLDFEEINRIVQTKLGSEWRLATEEKEDLEEFKKGMIAGGAEVIGISAYTPTNGSYGSVSPMVIKTGETEGDAYMIMLNVKDPGFSPYIHEYPNSELLTLSSGRDSDKYTLTLYQIAREKYETLPSYDPATGSLPLSLDRAIQIGRESLDDEASYRLLGASLSHVLQQRRQFELWFYSIEFSSMKKRESKSVKVLFDGSVVEETVTQISEGEYDRRRGPIRVTNQSSEKSGSRYNKINYENFWKWTIEERIDRSSLILLKRLSESGDSVTTEVLKKGEGVYFNVEGSVEDESYRIEDFKTMGLEGDIMFYMSNPPRGIGGVPVKEGIIYSLGNMPLEDFKKLAKSYDGK